MNSEIDAINSFLEKIQFDLCEKEGYGYLKTDIGVIGHVVTKIQEYASVLKENGDLYEIYVSDDKIELFLSHNSCEKACLKKTILINENIILIEMGSNSLILNKDSLYLLFGDKICYISNSEKGVMSVPFIDEIDINKIKNSILLNANSFLDDMKMSETEIIEYNKKRLIKAQ